MLTPCPQLTGPAILATAAVSVPAHLLLALLYMAKSQHLRRAVYSKVYIYQIYYLLYLIFI